MLYVGAVIIVSHYKSFLNSVTTRTLALSRGDLLDYAGNYSFYEKKYEQDQDLLKKQLENQQKEIKQTQEFIDRFRYKATKARQVQSRKIGRASCRERVETEEVGECVDIDRQES